MRRRMRRRRRALTLNCHGQVVSRNGPMESSTRQLPLREKLIYILLHPTYYILHTYTQLTTYYKPTYYILQS